MREDHRIFFVSLCTSGHAWNVAARQELMRESAETPDALTSRSLIDTSVSVTNRVNASGPPSESAWARSVIRALGGRGMEAAAPR